MRPPLEDSLLNQGFEQARRTQKAGTGTRPITAFPVPVFLLLLRLKAVFGRDE
jgi:hypothetical protein